jgi:hypothetical protein
LTRKLISSIRILRYTPVGVGNVFLFEIGDIVRFSLSRREWSIDLHIVDTKGFVGNPRITN